MREFEVPGEAASAISVQTKSQFPEIPWKAAIAMGNQLMHAHFDVNHAIV